MTRLTTLIAVCFLSFAHTVFASQLGAGWQLEGNASSLTFTSRVAGAQVETSFFKTLEGEISPDGAASFTVSLDSVDTGTDLLDARLRFLLFESFRNSVARIQTQITPEILVGLNQGNQKSVTLPLTLELNGVSKTIEAQVKIVVIAQDIVTVSTEVPVRLELDQFNLLAGLALLESAAGLDIVPETEVAFELLFKAIEKPSDVPVQDSGVLQACAGQIDTIAQSDQVYFTSGSTELETKSFPLLDAIVDTLGTCPTLSLRIEGHTDNVGDAGYNIGLSIGRAAEVVSYLAKKGVAPDRISATGFGENRPIADNNTRKGRWKNRRIEFIVPNRNAGQ